MRNNFERHPPGDHDFLAAGNVLFAALPVLAETAPAQRQGVVDLIGLMAPALEMQLTADPEIPESAEIRDGRGPFTPFTAAGGKLYSLGTVTREGGRMERLSAVFPDGSGVRALLPLPPDPPPGWFSPQFMMGNWLVLLVIVLPVALFWAVRGVSRPLRRFARAAEEFSIEGQHAPLPETGPEEIRVAARALNRMRDRVAGMAADRTRMLSAVGHDLRTSVTRMRLRAEFIAEPDIRDGQLLDLQRMDAMIDNALVFLRDGRAQGKHVPTDLVSLLQTLVDDFADMGSQIAFSGPDRLVCSVDAEAILRAVENLVQNALKFAENVTLDLSRETTGTVSISVQDNGPGIPETERAEMLKPFVRGDAARGTEGSGFGLGLSIAGTIAHAHGGRLELGDSVLGGLSARLLLVCK